MGVQTKLTLNEINFIAKKDGLLFTTIKATKDGITDSTFIGTTKKGERYVIKLYEEASYDEVRNEVAFLNRIKSLNVPLVVSKKVHIFKKKPIVIFSFLKGHEPKVLLKTQLRQIALFLAQFHDLSEKIEFSNTYRYSQKDLKTKINTIVHDKEVYFEVKEAFKKRYAKVKDVVLKPKHVIHGDLFPDNTKFDQDSLSGVFDFSNASKSDKLLDLAVVIHSWCFDRKDELDMPFVKAFLEEYNFYYDEQITLQKLKPYLLYSAVYYAASRFKTMYVDKKEVQYKSYKEFFVKFDAVEDLLG